MRVIEGNLKQMIEQALNNWAYSLEQDVEKMDAESQIEKLENEIK